MTRRGTRAKDLRTKAEQVTRENLEVLERINRGRVADGLCRHCGGPCPCWSRFGDVSPGVQHTETSWRRRTPYPGR